MGSRLPRQVRLLDTLAMGVFEELRIGLDAEAGIALWDQAERPRWPRWFGRGARRWIVPEAAMLENLADLLS